MLNSIIIHGRLTQDIELRQTQNGVSVCNFNVAVDRSYSSNGEKQTDFFTVVCWRGLAETVAKYFHKGKEIIVIGEMQSRKYTDKDGNNRIAWEIQANSIEFCGSKSDGANNQPAVTQTPTTQASQNNFVDLSSDDDFPF